MLLWLINQWNQGLVNFKIKPTLSMKKRNLTRGFIRSEYIFLEVNRPARTQFSVCRHFKNTVTTIFLFLPEFQDVRDPWQFPDTSWAQRGLLPHMHLRQEQHIRLQARSSQLGDHRAQHPRKKKVSNDELKCVS